MSLKLLFIVLFQLGVAQNIYALKCSSVISQGQLEVKKSAFYIKRTEEIYSLRDLNYAEVSFEGHLNLISQTLFMSGYLSFPEKGFRSSLSGSQIYTNIVNYFGLMNIKRIHDKWFDGDNLEVYLEGVASGLSREEAVRRTWSAKQAAKHGFTKIESVTEKNHAVLGHLSVDVLFVRP